MVHAHLHLKAIYYTQDQYSIHVLFVLEPSILFYMLHDNITLTMTITYMTTL